MPELPVSVRLALWVTQSWGRSADLPHAVARAHPDIDDVGGDVDRLALWHELGERALLVALPAPGDSLGMPGTSPDALAAAVEVGECVLAPSLGGLLVPFVADYGPAADRGTRVHWTAYDADPLPRHRVEGLDAREAGRGLARAVAEATAALEQIGGQPFDPTEAHALAAGGRRRWALPRELPQELAAMVLAAAGVSTLADRGLTTPHGALDAATLAAREGVLRTLRREADRALAVATNAAVASLAGWLPGR